MIECEPFNDRGVTQISAIVPNGHVVVNRRSTDVPTITLRNGDLQVSQGGFILEDSEGPVGQDLIYRATVEPLDRVIQRNLVPTPNFMHGAQGWATGTNRTWSIDADTTAHHNLVGHFTGNSGGGTVAAPPTLVGHVSSANYVNGNYTLTPTTGGGTAIATGDWMYWVHQQVATIAAPTVPAGWTLVAEQTVGTSLRTIVWRRKRVGGDTGYTVTVVGDGKSLGSLFWVRGANDDLPVVSALQGLTTQTITSVTTPTVTSINPSLVVSVSSAQTAANTAPPVAVIGNPTWQWTQGTSSDTKSLLFASQSFTDGGVSDPATVTYTAALTALTAFQLSFQNVTAVTGRVLAKAKVTALPAAVEPYRLTGRFRFTSSDVWLWSDVEAQGTWANLKATKATWEEVRSSTVLGSGDYARMFGAIVNPGTGAYYVPPVQAIGFSESRANTWVDFSFYFNPSGDIPATAEIWFMHGSNVREYIAQWFLDDIGITAGSEWLHHDTLYYMDGDTPKPTDSANRLQQGGAWNTSLDNSTLGWTGTAGNSISQWLSPTSIYEETICELIVPDMALPCGPVLLSDPVSTALGIWCGLMGIGTLTHAGRQAVYAILGRQSPVVVSQIRSWESGELVLMTSTLAERTQFLKVFKAGRILLIRNPDTAYPENNWYIGIGDLGEERVSPDARESMRSWTVPFVRVERPGGLIETSTGITWAQVEEMGTWLDIRETYGSWLDVMTADVGG